MPSTGTLIAAAVFVASCVAVIAVMLLQRRHPSRLVRILLSALFLASSFAGLGALAYFVLPQEIADVLAREYERAGVGGVGVLVVVSGVGALLVYSFASAGSGHDDEGR